MVRRTLACGGATGKTIRQDDGGPARQFAAFFPGRPGSEWRIGFRRFHFCRGLVSDASRGRTRLAKIFAAMTGAYAVRQLFGGLA
jgi:hypothetical protein